MYRLRLVVPFWSSWFSHWNALSSLFPFTLMKRSMSGKTEPHPVFKASALSGLNSTNTLWTALTPVDDRGVQAHGGAFSEVKGHRPSHLSCSVLGGGQVHVSINRCQISYSLTVLISHDLSDPRIVCQIQWIQCFPGPASIIFTLFQPAIRGYLRVRGLRFWGAPENPWKA